MTEYIPKIVSICSLILNLSTVVALLAKPIREKLFGIGDVREGLKCVLRSGMLSIYYTGQDREGKLRQHDYENFVLMYHAYKAMKGNSFIDKIYKEVQDMEVVT